MIVKFHPRGRGGGAGPVDYLLGKDRNRQGAIVLQGKPEEVRELIDASPYAKKYTSGVLSFAEKDLLPGQREKLMASFERVLMPGLDKDQYSVLWVEHRDKGRLELNFLIPNTELLTGRRLQPYYDRADRPRIDAWQTIVNGRLRLHDPNAPENRRALVTPSALPETKQAASEAITAGLLSLAASGELKTREDVTAALVQAGFTVARTTKTSISIADPDGGRNIRLRGALYEQSFNAGEGLRAEIENAAAAYRRDTESRIQRARTVCQSGTDRKRRENQHRYPRTRKGYEYGDAAEPAERPAYGRPDVAHGHDGVRSADRHEREHSVVAGATDNRQLHDHTGAEGYHQGAERDPVETERAYMGSELSGEQRRSPVPGHAGGDTGRSYSPQGYGLDFAETGITEHDRAGNTVAERIRAVTAGLLAKAGRLGERLRGMAEDVWSYATGEREAERAGQRLECAGAELKRTAEPVIEELNAAERRREAMLQRHRQPPCIQKPEARPEHEYEKTLDGPSL